MIYYLKKSTPSSKGEYLQIYENHYDYETKKKITKSFKKLGYVCDLISDDMPDPVAYYKKYVEEMNKELKQKEEPQIGATSSTKNLGYFLLKAMFDRLGMDNVLNIMNNNFKCKYKFSDMLRNLCYTQVINPGSKLKAFERVMPNIYGIESFSYDQILDAVKWIGADYHKYIELLNRAIEINWGRNKDKVYFDCTNYYFEIDFETEFQRKGPSKENQKTPLIGQGLLLDADQIPLDTVFYPGNQSEKPLIRERIEAMKSTNNITGRVIQVADKGLNCARNIYAAVVEANDGYIFSKSLRGTSLSEDKRKNAIREDDKLHQWVRVTNELGELLYKYKVLKHIGIDNNIKNYCYYKYKCNVDGKDIEFTVKEKRIVTYNPKLARKQKEEILKEVEKLRNLVSYKEAIHQELGNKSKYLIVEAKDKDGIKIKIAKGIDEDKVNEDLKYAGYNMIVTSEIDENPEHIYNTYHNLWRIEESFRIMKTYLEARPVFLSNEYSIYGHFTICYISLTLMRLLQFKVFKEQLTIDELFSFIRQYSVTNYKGNDYINSSTADGVYKKINEILGYSKLGNLYLNKHDLDLLLNIELDI